MLGDFEELCDEFRENKRLIEELETYNDTMIQGAAKATYKTIVSNKFNSKLFKEEHPDTYASYCSETVTKRFTVV